MLLILAASRRRMHMTKCNASCSSVLGMLYRAIAMLCSVCSMTFSIQWTYFTSWKLRGLITLYLAFDKCAPIVQIIMFAYQSLPLWLDISISIHIVLFLPPVPCPSVTAQAPTLHSMHGNDFHSKFMVTNLFYRYFGSKWTRHIVRGNRIIYLSSPLLFSVWA